MSHPDMTDVAAPSKGGLFEDIVEVLYAPVRVFHRTRNSGAGKYALVTAVIVGVLLFATRNLLQPWFDAQAEMALRMAQANAEAKGQEFPAAAASSIRMFTTWGIVIGAPLTMLIGPYINALLLLLGAKIFKAPISYGQAATVAVLGGVPRLLAFILMPIQALLIDGASARSLADLSIGPARFIDPGSVSPQILTLLGNLDVFRVWQIALIAIGITVVARVPRSTGWMVAIVMFASSVILQMAGTLFGQ